MMSESADSQRGSQSGRRYWRSLDEFHETPEFREALEREFPAAASLWPEGTKRRDFLKLMGASLAFAGVGGVAGCHKQPEEKIVPYVREPESIVPGKPLFYASAVTLGGYALGLLVESHMGRPTKVEGNPQHPASLGATDAFAQASVLTLYDPDRSQSINRLGSITTWGSFLTRLKEQLDTQRSKQGRGLRILTETVTSPTLVRQMRQLLDGFPEARWHQYEPVNRDRAHAGSRVAFGEPVEMVHHFDRADVILALDADFLCTGPARVRYAKDFSRRRRIDADSSGRLDMNRLYAVESTITSTGSKADHRWAVSPNGVEAFARAVAAELGVGNERGVENGSGSDTAEFDAEAIKAVAEDLRAHRGRSIVIAGDAQSSAVHALTHAINGSLGNFGETITAIEPVAEPVEQTESLRELVGEMSAGDVDLLVILGGNPVVTAPVDFAFTEALGNVGESVHLSLYEDETSIVCDWHIPETHAFESWSDARAFDGTATIVQPLIAPLYDGRSAHEVLAAALGNQGDSAYEIVRTTWSRFHQGGPQAGESQASQGSQKSDPSLGKASFERFWKKAVHDGVVPGTAAAEKMVEVRDDVAGELGEFRPSRTGYALAYRPDPTIHDGRFANNGWLQELPKPLTKLTWDNAALISPNTAEKVGVESRQFVEVSVGERSLRLPVWIQAGIPDDTLTLHFGYGRTRAGHVGNGAGFDVYRLRDSETMWSASDAKVVASPERYPLACTQEHHRMDGRELVRSGTYAEWEEQPDDPAFMRTEHGPTPDISMFPDFEYEGYKWGMSIDMTACVGCGACVTACQSENNIPVVGREQVALGREMHWIRIDSYYEGNPARPDSLRAYHQPVPCMHCEKAPCEPVCPVGATTHSEEGLNEMTYNRCVGTRYCSNNCPYKVRRFNFLEYNGEVESHPSLQLLKNPDVTVRSRGVMEKCTYCVQRISAARIGAEKEDRTLRDGELVSACQQVCPTEAIVFGDLNDETSRLSRRTSGPLYFELLGELNTRPRTTYLAALRNPNPRLEPPSEASNDGQH